MKISTIVTLAALACLPTITACNPCDIEIVGNTAIVNPGECPIDLTDGTDSESTGPAPTSGSGDTGDSTDGTTIIDPTESSGAVDETEGTPPLVCEGQLEPGVAWGPCLPDGTCNENAIFCITSPKGEVCMPACDAGGCPDFGCTNGTCRDDGTCAPFCGDDSDCPHTNMVCDLDAPPAPTCVWK